MRLQHYTLGTIFILGVAAAPLMTGCSNYEVPEGWGKDQLSEEFKLRITMGEERGYYSRAAIPVGGEEGEGREFGQHHENDVENIALFYYNGSINAPAETAVTRIIYKDGIAFHPTTSGSPDTPIRKEALLTFSQDETHYQYHSGDQFIVVANMGDINATTLGDLRNKLVTNAWRENGTIRGNFDMFVMSNESMSIFTPGNGSEANPHKIDVTIERVAARLDYCTDNSTPTTVPGSSAEAGKPALMYPVKDKDASNIEHNIGTLYLTHVRPFNVMQEPAYLIKRCAAPEAKTEVTYLADEADYSSSVDFDKFPIVLEPHTWTKTAGANYSTWYGESYLPNVSSDAWFIDEYRVHNNTSNDGFSADGISDNATGECTKYYVVDYANENTQQVSSSASNTLTGFYLRGVYVPNEVYDLAEDVALNLPTTFSAGTTFYRYRPMVSAYDETQAVCFTSLAEATKFGDSRPAVPYVVETFAAGICYYPVYLRHDSPGYFPDETPHVGVTPMEYAIVRNNIYRLKIELTGPGYSTIPDVPNEPLGIKPYIYVRRWYQINHPEIEI